MLFRVKTARITTPNTLAGYRRHGINYRLVAENTTRDPLARAIRTARAWAGLSREQLAVKVGVVGETIGRYERGEWKADPPDPIRRKAIADACGVPTSFLEQGFEADEDAVAALREEVRRLNESLAALSQDVLRHSRELAAIRDRDRRSGGQEGDEQ